MRTIAILIASLALASIVLAEQDLQLPTRRPDLAATPEDALGSNQDGIGLEIGQQVRDFAIQTHDGKPITRDDLLGKDTLLVVFYRGGWCPYCNMQIRALTSAWAEFEQRNVMPVLISVDRTDGASLAQRSYEIPFPVLSDPDLVAHEAFEVVLQVDDATVERYLEYGIDLEQWSGQEHHKIAVTAAFVLDSAGKVQWAHTSTDYKTRPSPAQLLLAIDGLQD